MRAKEGLGWRTFGVPYINNAFLQLRNQKKSRCTYRHTFNEKLRKSVERDWRVDVRSTSKFILIPSNIHNIIMLRGRR